MYNLNILDKTKILYKDIDAWVSMSRIIEWRKDFNTNIEYMISISGWKFDHKTQELDFISKGSLTGNYDDIEIPRYMTITDFTLIFYTEEDRNLFKLTWM